MSLLPATSSEPGVSGTTVYLNGGPDLSDPLSRVEGCGRELLMPKEAIGEYGFVARFRDTAGNLVALHSIP